MVMQAAGRDALDVNYIPYDAGGTAMAALLSGEIKALATGLSRRLICPKQARSKSSVLRRQNAFRRRQTP